MTENLTKGLNLDIKQPLIVPKPLGRKLITPKFLSPLGAKKLSSFDTANLSNSDSKVIQPKPEKTASKAAVIQPEKAPQNSQEKTEIPPLPQAIRKISTLQSLAQPSELISSTVADEIQSPNLPRPVPISPAPVRHIQKAPARDIPNSWSSIAELVGEIKVENINQTEIVQPLTEKRQQDNQLNSLATTKLQNSKAAKKTDLNEIEPSHQVIQTYNSFENSSASTLMSTDDLENLEALAREVYQMLKQRWEIEGERRGNNYSGRLPW
ncbi:MAG: hypothetical protein VKL60_21140 [Sphaerospermopsis sp.]|nr:hypothetical protein [Sphaerospermopsis sp.]